MTPAQFQNAVPSKILSSLANFELSGQIYIHGRLECDFHGRKECNFHRTLNFLGLPIIHIRIKREVPVIHFAAFHQGTFAIPRGLEFLASRKSTCKCEQASSMA